MNTKLRVSVLRRAATAVFLPAVVSCSAGDPDAAPAAPPNIVGPVVSAPNGGSDGVAGAPVNNGSPPPAGTATPPSGSIQEGAGDVMFPPSPSADLGSEGGGDTTGAPDDGQPPGSDVEPVPGGVCPSDTALQALLRQYAPADEELAEAFAEYLDAEVGPLTCATSGTGGTRTITQTIVVPPNTVYDGKGETLTADPVAMKCDLTEGEQAESQRPYFLLAPGASLRNVTIDYPGCEGVHMMGDNVLQNITWVNVGEDAASVRSYFPGGDITIKDSESHDASDKTFQFNAPGNLLIQNFVGTNMGKLVRQNGGTEFEFHVDLNNVTVSGVISAVVQSDSPICFVRHHALTFTFTGSGDKSDRVFRDIPVENVTAY